MRFRKSAAHVPSSYFAWEAAGLRWLAEASASGGAPVAEVLEVADDHLDLVRLDAVTPTADAAHAFGEQLAHTHAAGADAFGNGPPECREGFFGPTASPLPLVLGGWDSWGTFYAEARVEPMAALLRDRGVLDRSDVAVLDRLSARLRHGVFDTDDAPSRTHGDLWAGNLMWTPQGATLIDPAAHGGHSETDLAVLALFSAPFLDLIRDGYANARPLASGWTDRIELHQLHCLLVHAAVFGGGYVAASLAIAAHYC